MKKTFLAAVAMVITSALFAGGQKEPFHKTVDFVDMSRFSGDWYVAALIPSVFEKGAE